MLIVMFSIQAALGYATHLYAKVKYFVQTAILNFYLCYKSFGIMLFLFGTHKICDHRHYNNNKEEITCA